MRIVHSDQSLPPICGSTRTYLFISENETSCFDWPKHFRTNTKRRSNDKSPSVRTNSHSGAQSNNCYSLSHSFVNHRGISFKQVLDVIAWNEGKLRTDAMKGLSVKLSTVVLSQRAPQKMSLCGYSSGRHTANMPNLVLSSSSCRIEH